MKTIAIFASLIGFSVLHASSASADVTNVQCTDSVVFQEFNNPPAACIFGSSYDAGDVGIFRICSFLNSGAQSFCTESFTESFFHSAQPVFDSTGHETCTDGGFIQQVNTNVQSTCPF